MFSHFPLSLLEEISYARKIALDKKKKDKRISLIAKIEQRSYLELSNVIDVSRPYGIPAELVGIQEHIWRLVLDFIYDPEDIIRISKTCMLFQDILRKKLTAALFPVVIDIVFQQEEPEHVRINELMKFRVLSRTSKIVVERILERQCKYSSNDVFLHGAGEFVDNGVYGSLKFNTLAEVCQITSHFEAKGITESDIYPRVIQIDEFNLRHIIEPEELNCFDAEVSKLLSIVGRSVKGFFYTSVRSTCEGYKWIQTWAGFMPNLKTLYVGGDMFFEVGREEQAEVLNEFPFPLMPALETLIEGMYSFPQDIITSILQASLNIKCLRLSESRNLTNEDEFFAALQQLRLEALYTSQQVGLNFLIPRRFNWPLMVLDLEQNQRNPTRCTMNNLFQFMEQFKDTLEEIRIVVDIVEDDSIMDLPNLTTIIWSPGSSIQSLDFVLLLKNLKDLTVTEPPAGIERHQILEYRGFVERMQESNIGHVLPTLKRLKVVSENGTCFYYGRGGNSLSLLRTSTPQQIENPILVLLQHIFAQHAPIIEQNENQEEENDNEVQPQPEAQD